MIIGSMARMPVETKVSQFDSKLENLCDITNDSTNPTHKKYSSALHSSLIEVANCKNS